MEDIHVIVVRNLKGKDKEGGDIDVFVPGRGF